MDPSTEDKQEYLGHQYSRPSERAGHKENLEKQEPGHFSMGILYEGHFHHQGSLFIAHSSTPQSEKRHVAMHMALQFMAEDNFLPLENPAPQHSHMG